MSDFGIVTEAGTVRFQRVLPGPIERVWAHLTDSELRGKRLASGRMGHRAGGKVDLNFRHADLSPRTGPTPDRFKHSEAGHINDGRITFASRPAC